MSSTVIIVLVVVIVIVVALAAIGAMLARRASLRRRFGPEYDRLVQEQGGRIAAERELRERERRHAELSVKPLPEEARSRYAVAWEQVQVRFIDTPAEAVGEADALVTQVMAERGYPTGDFDDQAANLSVEHGHTLGHYRDAHDLHLRNERGEATTEQLRQALVHYRALFADLLGMDPTRYPASPSPSSSPSSLPEAEASSSPEAETSSSPEAEASSSPEASLPEAEAGGVAESPGAADERRPVNPNPDRREERMHHA
jgi:hypothetical protein